MDELVKAYGNAHWQQKANSQSNLLFNLFVFIYEFLSGRLTVLAFAALLSVVTIRYKYFGEILTLSLTIILFFFISDTFKIFWNGIHLRYSVTKKGILFDWGFSKEQHLFIPYIQINSIHVVNTKTRKAIIFDNKLKIKNRDYGISKEPFFNQLSFENIVDLENLTTIITENFSGKIIHKNPLIENSFSDRLPDSTLYIKLLQLLAFVFVYLSTHLSLKIIDNNFLPVKTTLDKVIQQTKIVRGLNHVSSVLETSQGYSIPISEALNYMDHDVSFQVSPIFNDITRFKGRSYINPNPIENAYVGIYLFFKLMALGAMLFSASYIFYKRGKVHFEDLSVFLWFPIISLILAFYLFHF